MIKKNNKKGLLNEDTPYNHQAQWIPLEDMTYNKSRKPQYNQKQYKYTKIQNQPQYTSNNNNKNQSFNANSKQQQQHYNPNIIKLNGQVFKKVQNKEIKQKKSNIPPMHASCRYCQTLQSVQGTAECFQCGKCHKINRCTPMYKIFRCCNCHSKVLYASGISNIVRCTKCSMVNSIPIIHNNNPYQIIKQPIQEPYKTQRYEKETQFLPYEIISEQRSDLSFDNEYPSLQQR